MNEKQRKVHSALSSFTFTPGYEFTPRMEELGIDKAEIHSILVELKGAGPCRAVLRPRVAVHPRPGHRR